MGALPSRQQIVRHSRVQIAGNHVRGEADRDMQPELQVQRPPGAADRLVGCSITTTSLLTCVCNSSDATPLPATPATRRDEIGLTARPIRTGLRNLVLCSHVTTKSPHFPQHLSQVVLTGGQTSYAVFCGGARNHPHPHPLSASPCLVRDRRLLPTRFPAISALTILRRHRRDSTWTSTTHCIVSADLERVLLNNNACRCYLPYKPDPAYMG